MSVNLTISCFDRCPAEAAACIGSGLDEFNQGAAPLYEVVPLSCVAYDANGRVVGGVIGRCWGSSCELQQLWVEPAFRRKGLGADLVCAFEHHAISKGCSAFFLETFSFQAPRFYEQLGYAVEYARRGYPHGIAKFHMAKTI